jgi:hypothetical protein
MSASRTLLVGCGALAREVAMLRRLHGWTHLDVALLPADLHNRPERIAPAVQARIQAARDGHAQVLVLYGDCGTAGALDAVCAAEGAAHIGGAHCYAFLAGGAAFDALMEEEPGSFFLTDFLARHFDRLVVRGLALDRHPELREAYFAHYARVVHLAQRPDAAVAEKARAAAEWLGLPLTVRETGTHALERFLAPRAA